MGVALPLRALNSLLEEALTSFFLIIEDAFNQRRFRSLSVLDTGVFSIRGIVMIEWNGRRVKLGRVFCFVFGGLLASHGAIALYYEADKAAKHRSTRTELHNKYLTIELLKIDNNRLRSRVHQMQATLEKQKQSRMIDPETVASQSIRTASLIPAGPEGDYGFYEWHASLLGPETSNHHELPVAWDFIVGSRSHVDGFNILHYQVAPSRPARSAEKASSD